jgi:hypothetical protein
VNDRKHILCVNHHGPLLASRCRILESAGYKSNKATPRTSQALLISQKFDLVVSSNATELEITRIANVSDGAQLLVLDEFISSSEMLNTSRNGYESGEPDVQRGFIMVTKYACWKIDCSLYDAAIPDARAIKSEGGVSGFIQCAVAP